MRAPANPSFSVIVCTYQRRRLACEAVQALCGSDYGAAVEIIVVVDGSRDGTAEALRKLQCPFPLTIIEQDNHGLGHARNRGAAEATGEILLFLDDDMIAAPDLLTQHASTHGEGADAVVGVIPLAEGSPAGFLTEGMAIGAERAAEENASGELTLPFQIFGGQLSVRRDVFESLGGFDSIYTADGKYGMEDADFGAKLLENHVARANPLAVSYHRYVVSPRENMRRAVQQGEADVRFAHKHPRHARDLFALSHGFKRSNRLLYRPLARLPLVPRLLSALAVGMAELLLRTPLRSNQQVARAFYAARQVAYWSGVARAGGMPDLGSVLVLCYHAVADHSFDPLLKDYSIPPGRLARQLDALKRRGFRFVDADFVVDALRNTQPIASKAVLLTFDDCYADLLDAARDILQPRQIPALAFAVTGMNSDTNEWDQQYGATTLRLLDAAGLNALRKRGVAIGGHSRSHRPLTTLTDSELIAETRGAADDLETAGLPRPACFAFPFGDRDSRVIAAVAAAGYRAGFGLTGDCASWRSDIHDLPRVEISGRDGAFRFWFKTAHPRLAAILRTRLLKWLP